MLEIFQDPTTTALVAVYGSEALRLVREMAEESLKDRGRALVGRLVERWKGREDAPEALDQEEVASEARDILTTAYALWLERLFKQVEAFGEDPADFEAARHLLADEEVTAELLRPVLDSGDAPDADVFAAAWEVLDLPPLPPGMTFQALLRVYQKDVQRQRKDSESFRSPLVAEALLDILKLQRDQAGARVQPSVAGYARRLQRKYQVLDLANLQPEWTEGAGKIHLRDAFIAQDVREDPPPQEIPDDLRQRLIAEGHVAEDELPEGFTAEQLDSLRRTFADRSPQPVLEVVADPNRDRLVLLGGPGSGKSTLMRYLLLSLLADADDDAPSWRQQLAGHFPVLIELRDYFGERQQGRCQEFLSYLDHLGQTEGWAITEGWLDQKLQDGPSLVLFDGLDEVFDREERAKVREQIVGFAERYPKARIVVTSRPVGYKAATLADADFDHFGVETLDDPKIRTFLEGWFELSLPNRPKDAETRRERVLRGIERSSSIRLLAGNPMLLTIMAQIGQLQELPRERWRFYAKAVEVLVHHWDVNRHLESFLEETKGVEAPYLGIEDKTELLERLAWRMQGSEKGLAGNFIAGSVLRDEVRSFLEARYQVVPAESKVVAEGVLDQLRRRNSILCLRGAELYGFVHRTFLEYFCAASLVRRVEKDPEFGVEELRAVIRDNWGDEAWEEPIRLLCGMVGPAYAAGVLEELIEVDPEWEPTHYAHGPRHLILAVQGLAEVRRREELGEVPGRMLGEIWEISQRESLHSGEIWRRALLESAEEIGQLWPGAEDYEEKVLGGAKVQDWAWYLTYGLLCHIGKQREEIRRRLEIASQESGSTNQRAVALWSLVHHWTDETTRQFLELRAVEDPDGYTRSRALESLAQHWTDETTRQFLQQRAVEDPDRFPRRQTLRSLAQHWTDETTRQFLQQRAVEDPHSAPRGQALASLAQHWTDETTRQLLQQRAVEDPDPFPRIQALQSLVLHFVRGKAQRILSVTISIPRDLDRSWPFIDPRDPLPPTHIQKAAEELDIPEPELRAHLEAATEVLGYNPILGAGKPEDAEADSTDEDDT